VIVLLESIHPDAQALLESAGRVLATSELGEVGDASVRAIVTRGKGRVMADVIKRWPTLEVVARCGVGLDNIDTAAAARAGVTVVHAPGSTTHAVVEHAVMLMLALARSVVALDRAVAAGDWDVRNGYEGRELRNMRMGVVGLGAIGGRVAALGEALGMEVVCTTRRSAPAVRRVTLGELLATSDVVQLCVPLTDDTRLMIGAAQLDVIKPGALLVNTARGPLVDQTAVRAALDNGRLGGYATDVWDPEPPAAGDGLLGHPRVLVTPHVAALTDVTYREICMRPVEAVVAVLRGDAPDPGCVYGGV
jgi:phosphoglycerate dehydrogenase-like enzyme